MKITIELDPVDVKALKKFLEQIKRIEEPSKEHITEMIQQIVNNALEDDGTPMSDYIQLFRDEI